MDIRRKNQDTQKTHFCHTFIKYYAYNGKRYRIWKIGLYQGGIIID